MAEQHTLYKLIVLYMLRSVDFPLTFSQISDFLLEKNYTTYFVLQASMSELEEAEFVRAETVQNVTYFTLTPEGEETLGFFVNRISPALRADIDSYLRTNQLRMRDEASVLADYYKNTNGEYEVRCLAKEQQSTLMDLTLTVPAEEQAQAIVSQWKKKCQSIYAYLMNELMRRDEAEKK